MDRESKRMLKFMRTSELCKDGCLFSDFYEIYGHVTGIPEQRIMACVRYLESCGYIRYGTNQNGQTVGFELEHKAYHRLYFRVSDCWLFIRNSILVPILVAFFTALLTTELWPSLKALLSGLGPSGPAGLR